MYFTRRFFTTSSMPKREFVYFLHRRMLVISFSWCASSRFLAAIAPGWKGAMSEARNGSCEFARSFRAF
jgi:hypothetical protein